MSRKLNVDFHQVKISQPSTLSFEEIVKKVAGTPQDQRPEEVRLRPVYISTLDYGWQDTWEGEIVRLRMDDLPIKGNLAGEIKDIQLGPDEGIGEQSAFIYHPATGILALQSNKGGAAPKDFARYFEIFGGGNTEITLYPVVQPNALKKLTELKDVDNFEIKIASLSSTAIFGGEDKAVEDILHLAEDFKAPSINIEFKASPKKKQSSLSLNKVFEVARYFLRASQQKQNKITALKVSGTDEDDNEVLIDLLRYRMRENIDINYNPGRNHSFSYNIRRKAIQEAWNNRYNEIMQMFGS